MCGRVLNTSLKVGSKYPSDNYMVKVNNKNTRTSVLLLLIAIITITSVLLLLILNMFNLFDC